MHVVITGASQVIGRALAIQFSKRERMNLYLISRSEQKLMKVAGECQKIITEQMAEFIVDFAVNGYKYFNGKILPVSGTTP